MPTKPSITPPTWASAENNTAPYSFVAPDSTHQANGVFTGEKPASGPFNYVLGLLTAWVKYFYGLLPGVNANEALVITSNVVTPTQGNGTFQTAGGTVNTVNTTNLNAGNIWIAFGNGSNGTTLTYGDGGGGALNLVGAASVVLTSTNDSVTFQYNATTGNMDEIGRSSSLVPAKNMFTQIITTMNTLTVPGKVRGIYWRALGGGGGGGGGGGSANSTGTAGTGGAGGAGGATVIGSSATQARGGLGGGGGGGAVWGSTSSPAVGSAGGSLSATIASGMLQSGTQVGTAGSPALEPSPNGTGGAGGGVSAFTPFDRILIAAANGGAGSANPGVGGTGTSGAVNLGIPGCGGGGASSGFNTCGAGGGSGSYGEYAEGYLAVTPGGTLVVTIGAGGTGGTAGTELGGGNAGGAGGAGGSGLAILTWVQ